MWRWLLRVKKKSAGRAVKHTNSSLYASHRITAIVNIFYMPLGFETASLPSCKRAIGWWLEEPPEAQEPCFTSNNMPFIFSLVIFVGTEVSALQHRCLICLSLTMVRKCRTGNVAGANALTTQLAFTGKANVFLRSPTSDTEYTEPEGNLKKVFNFTIFQGSNTLIGGRARGKFFLPKQHNEMSTLSSDFWSKPVFDSHNWTK